MFVLIALPDPCAVKGENGVITPLQVKLHTHERADFDIFTALVIEPDASCDNVAFFKNGIEQVKLCFKNLVLKNNCQCFTVAVAGGKTVQNGLDLADVVGFVEKVGCKVVVGGEQTH